MTGLSPMSRFGLTKLPGLVTVFGLLAVWQALYWAVGEIALRSPWETLQFTRRFVASDSFFGHLHESLRAFGAALVLSIVLGLAIGFTLGLSRFWRAVFEPVQVAFYSVPKITLYPIVLLCFGLGVSAKIAFGTIHGVVPIAVFTINGLRNGKPVLAKTARVLRLSRLEAVWSIHAPAALPEIFSGLRVGFSLTLIGTLLGEMFASQRGLGFLLMNVIGLHNVDIIMCLTSLIVVFAATGNVALLAIDQRLYRQV